jgi:hypothetical protein
LLDVVFFVDMLLSFFTAYVLVDGNGRSTWVMSHNKIVHHYLATWFPLDAFTIFVPLSFDIISIAESTSSNSNSSSTTGEASGGGDAGSALRVLRVLRLTKLVRLVRASRLCVLPYLVERTTRRVRRAALLGDARLLKRVWSACGARCRYERWKARITLSSGLMIMIQCTLMVLVTAHL